MRALAALWIVAAGIAALPAASHAGGGVSKIIYVNRCVGGCVITKGSNSSIDDTSGTPMGSDGQMYTLSEFAHDDQTWQALMECVREVYAPYDVTITDVDPGNVPHHEAIAAGLSQQIGWNAGGVAGVPSSCTPTDNVISFSFLNQLPPSEVDLMCLIVAQESGHSFGLPDHIYDCTDPMTYLNQCGRAFFRNKAMPCGEFEQGVPGCACGGSRVNNHVMLSEAFGHGTQPPPPTVAIAYPADGAQLAEEPIFEIDATDPRGVARIEILLNGWRWYSYDVPSPITPPFSWPESYPVQLTEPIPPGTVDVEVRAYNDRGLPGAFPEPSYSVATITGTRGAPCTSADECFPGQACEDGRCFWDQPTGELGDACEIDQDCIGPDTYDGRCEDVDGGRICTLDCFAGVNDACPEGFYCPGAEGAEGVCAPGSAEEPGGGCCSVGPESRGSLAGRLVLVLAVGLLVLRRRRMAA